tara:strand:- start:96399 stop:96923 length:525 start_codon:yes stop_codon:yes gene_type:complete
MRNLLLFLVVLGTLSFTLTKEVSKSTEKATIASGKISPTFSFKNTEDKLISLADFKGKYVYIDIWATWCEPCKEELEALEEIKQTFTENIAFVGVSVDYNRDTNKWKQFIATKSLKGTQVIADNNWYSDFIRAYDITTIPRFILIDPEGKIVEAYAPKPSQNQLKTLFERMDIK